MIQRETSSTGSRPHRSPDGPVRTCVGCRKRELAAGLLRIVAVPTGNGVAVTVDHAGKLPGRGAWLHPAAQCLQAAVKRRAFVRALRITGAPDVSGVEEQVNRLVGPGQQNR